MVKRCGGHATVDALLPGHSTLVHDSVAQGSQHHIPFELDAVGMVLAGDHWRTHPDRIKVLMTPRLQELRLKELVKGLDSIKRDIQAGNLGTACERLLATYSELKVISRRRKLQK